MKSSLKHKILISVFLLVLLSTQVIACGEVYQFPWPGMLPDNPFYKLKVLRNKIVSRLIISPEKRVEFDLLMADKTLYAGKLLLDKGKPALAAETALKGENYFSILVADYRSMLGKKMVAPERLKQRIAAASEAESKLIDYLIDHSRGADQETFRKVLYFSQQNRQTFVLIQKAKRE